MISLVQSRFETPAENLAADEALLDLCDESDHNGFLRFWESPVHFVVLGYGKEVERETFREECSRLEIPILRRCSGGGTVLQGPGCLNYSLVLPLGHAPELETISGANRYIMERVRTTISRESGRDIQILGHTDLVHQGRKFSGNAQRRKRRALLFHGSFLTDFDLPLISRTLRMPDQQPAYRDRREHTDFVINFPLKRVHLQAAFADDWQANESHPNSRFFSLTADLVEKKYSRPDWNERH